jgi:MFS family permease
VTARLVSLNRRTFASLKHRNYKLFFIGQVVAVTGTWMQRIAQSWLVLQLTHSPVAVGILAFAQFAPFSTFSLFAGVIVDRLDARRLVIATQASAMGLASLLAGLALSGAVEAWHVYVLGFLAGTVQVLDAPARQALTYRMVGPGELPNAIALTSGLFNGARIFGPAIGGVLIAAFGPGVCFAVNAGSFLAVLAVLFLMRQEEFSPVTIFERPTFLRGIGEGLRYVAGSRRALTVLLLVAAVSMFAVNNNVLLPVLAKRTLSSGAGTFGLLSAFFGAGALIGALAAAAIGRARVKLVLLGAAGFGASQLLIAPERSLAIVLALLLAGGVCFSLWSANSNSLLQLEAPDHLRGRVVGLFFFGFAGTGSVGGLLAGWLADVGRTELAYAVAGSVALAATVVAGLALGAGQRFARRWPRPFTAETRP